MRTDPCCTWPCYKLGQISLRGRPFEKFFTFSKIMQRHLLSHGRAVASYKRRHHGDASSAPLVMRHRGDDVYITAAAHTSHLREVTMDNQFLVANSPYATERASLETFRNTMVSHFFA